MHAHIHSISRNHEPNRRQSVAERVIPSVLVNVTLVLVSITLGLGIIELYFRAFQPQAIVPRYVESSSYGIRKNIGNVDGLIITSEYRHGFHTNAQGFRGTKEYAIPKPRGTYRVIVLGDSATLGHGVEDHETFSAILADGMMSRRPIEVINMGVSGFGTAEELVQLQHIGWKYEPDLVVLAYFPNDPYNNVVSGLFKIEDGTLVPTQQAFVPAIYVRDRLYSFPGYSFLCQNSHALNFIRNQVSGFFIEQLARQNNISSQTSSTLTHEESELTALLLERMVAEVSAHRVPMLVLNIPVIERGQFIDNFPKERPLRQSIADRVYVIDVKKTIYEGHALRDLSYEKDAHPTPYAHRIIGRWLSNFVAHDM